MKKKKHPLTLLEIIVVIFLITLITGAIGYNMRGALDKGRAFRTEQGMQELHDLLMLAVSDGVTLTDVHDHPEQYLTLTGLAKDPGKLLKDGWGNQYQILYNSAHTDLIIRSDKYEAFKAKATEEQEAIRKKYNEKPSG